MIVVTYEELSFSFTPDFSRTYELHHLLFFLPVFVQPVGKKVAIVFVVRRPVHQGEEDNCNEVTTPSRRSYASDFLFPNKFWLTIGLKLQLLRFISQLCNITCHHAALF